jgi:hypothetical protein
MQTSIYIARKTSINVYIHLSDYWSGKKFKKIELSCTIKFSVFQTVATTYLLEWGVQIYYKPRGFYFGLPRHLITNSLFIYVFITLSIVFYIFLFFKKFILCGKI